MSTGTAAATRHDLPRGMAEHVQEQLGRYRADLYRGRGPGISEDEWLRNTSLRPAVAGIPTAVSREELHLRTLRARGQRDEAAAEAHWAAAWFPGRVGTAADNPALPAETGRTPLPADSNRPGRLAKALGWLAVGWLAVYGLRRARSRHEEAGR